MPKNYDYQEKISLKHHERPAKIDLNTGEVKEIKSKNKLPEGKEKYQEKFMTDSFSKLNMRVLPFLHESFNSIELKIILKMIELTEFNTNSLNPLNNDTSLRELSKLFDVGINQIKKYLEHLYLMGVFAQFKIYKENKEEYWILSPYISWQGENIDTALKANFKNTKIEKYLRDLKNN